ncbi:MAG: ATP-dependent helicase, partial [Bdellovibrionales bacterium]
MQNTAPRQTFYLDDLNEPQRRAVEALQGPVLVLAGAGTGKTRALTTRLAHLLATGTAMPGEVMAVTFTNKAAAEIRERVAGLLGRSVEGWYLGTFHALAARLLRPFAERVDLKPNFTILGTDDQLRLIKQLLEAENIDTKKSPPRAVLSAIERFKDRGLTPADVNGEVGDIADGKILKLYRLYQERLIALNACDFGDLLLHQLTLLRKNPDVLEKFQNRFRFLLVDEYQDTNIAQYLWLRLLAQKNKNICVVGDEDQSIYGWRGAEVGNILRFEEDFPGAEVVKLEENYRSTGHILGTAATLISHNHMRLGKTLWTQAREGEKVQIRSLWDGEEEARWVADEIESLQRRGITLSDIAIMVRAGFQTRQFEERFIQLGIPYRVLVGARFYERQEIRDAMAYLRVVASADDDLAFERIVNLPKRGIGPAAMQQIHGYARIQDISLATAAYQIAQTDELTPRLRNAFQALMSNFARWRNLLDTMAHNEVAKIILDESGYTGLWQNSKEPDAPARLENLKELVSAMAEFDTLPAFLEHVSLVLEATEDKTQAQVSLMTLHGAKGLEFPYVFLPGWEEEIFPSRLSLSENGTAGLEEERRLAYVGITRARSRAWISHVANRFVHGSWSNPLPSRFLAELPDQHIERLSSIQGRNTQNQNSWNADVLPKPHRSSQPQKRGPNLWEQLQATNSVRAPLEIEGKAREIKSTKSKNGLALGMRVAHAKFGAGTIIRIEGDKLEISFDDAGRKKVIDRFVSQV